MTRYFFCTEYDVNYRLNDDGSVSAWYSALGEWWVSGRFRNATDLLESGSMIEISADKAPGV